MSDLSIAAAPQATTANLTDRLPVSQGDGLAKTITVQQIVDLAGGSVAYAVNYDDVGGNIAYLGEAAPGSAGSAAVWRIRKLDSTAGDLVVTWADGNDNFDNVWNNRLSLTYS